MSERTPSAAIIKHYTGIVLRKGIDRYGTFLVLRHVNKYGTHEMEFSVEESDLDLYLLKGRCPLQLTRCGTAVSTGLIRGEKRRESS